MAELTLKLDRAYTSAYASIDFAPARNLIQTLRSKFKIAVVTNQTLDAQLHKLMALDPSSTLIDCLVTSEEMGIEKPHASVFSECLKRLKVAPHEALMIGDDWDNDIIGASAVGVPSIFLSKNATSRILQSDPLVITTNSISNIALLLQEHLS